jgi:hypothetical protein
VLWLHGSWVWLFIKVLILIEKSSWLFKQEISSDVIDQETAMHPFLMLVFHFFHLHEGLMCEHPQKHFLIPHHKLPIPPGVSFREWSTFAEMMRERLHHHGIAATSDVQSLPRLERKTCCMGS